MIPPPAAEAPKPAKASLGSRLWPFAGFIFALALGIAVRYWAASQWRANFDSDEAIFALMARHLSAGHYMPMMYGTQRLGSIEAILASWLFKGFGETVMAFRWAALLLMAGFLCLNTVWVARVWGRTSALLSLLFLSLPGFHILAWTYQPIGAYAALLFLGTLFLLVLNSKPRTRGLAWVQAFALGLISGLGLWANQMYVVYMIAGLVPRLAESSTWQVSRERLKSRFTHKRLRFDLLLTLGVIVLLTVGVLAFFSSGCDPRPLFHRVALLGKGALGVLVVTFALAVLKVMPGARAGLTSAFLFLGGAIAGYAPQWATWLEGGPALATVIAPSCPVETPGRLLFTVRDLLPAMLGLPRLFEGTWAARSATAALWALAVPASLAAIAWYVHQHRETLGRFRLLLPLRQDQSNGLQLLLLFSLPIVLGILGSNTVDVHSVRHLLVSWQASAILFAIFLSDAIIARPRMGWVLAASWLVCLGVTNLALVPGSWNVRFTAYDEGQIAELEAYLSAQGATRGYADYWGAYTLDFLTQERLTLAPYNGLDRMPEYSREVSERSPYAILLPADRPAAGTDLGSLCRRISEEHDYSGEGPARQAIAERCSASAVLARTTIGPWDVWVLTDDSNLAG